MFQLFHFACSFRKTGKGVHIFDVIFQFLLTSVFYICAALRKFLNAPIRLYTVVTATLIFKFKTFWKIAT